HDVSRVPGEQSSPLGPRDHVVRRRDEGAEIADDRGVIAQRTEGTEGGHGSRHLNGGRGPRRSPGPRQSAPVRPGLRVLGRDVPLSGNGNRSIWWRTNGADTYA